MGLRCGIEGRRESIALSPQRRKLLQNPVSGVCSPFIPFHQATLSVLHGSNRQKHATEDVCRWPPNAPDWPSLLYSAIFRSIRGRCQRPERT